MMKHLFCKEGKVKIHSTHHGLVSPERYPYIPKCSSLTDTQTEKVSRTFKNTLFSHSMIALILEF